MRLLITDMLSTTSFGYCDSNSKPIANANVFCEIDALLQDLEGRGFRPLFWKVARDDNGEAMELAAAALHFE